MRREFVHYFLNGLFKRDRGTLLDIIRLLIRVRRNADDIRVPRPAPGIDRLFHSHVAFLGRLARFVPEQQLNVFERSTTLKHLNGKRVAPFMRPLSLDTGLDVKLPHLFRPVVDRSFDRGRSGPEEILSTLRLCRASRRGNRRCPARRS